MIHIKGHRDARQRDVQVIVVAVQQLTDEVDVDIRLAGDTCLTRNFLEEVAARLALAVFKHRAAFMLPVPLMEIARIVLAHIREVQRRQRGRNVVEVDIAHLGDRPDANHLQGVGMQQIDVDVVELLDIGNRRDPQLFDIEQTLRHHVQPQHRVRMS